MVWQICAESMGIDEAIRDTGMYVYHLPFCKCYFHYYINFIIRLNLLFPHWNEQRA